MTTIYSGAICFILICFIRWGWQYFQRVRERKRGMLYLLQLERMRRKLQAG